MTLPPPGSLKPWAGTHVAEARRILADALDWPVPCNRCGRPVRPTHWHLGHKLDRQAHPLLHQRRRRPRQPPTQETTPIRVHVTRRIPKLVIVTLRDFLVTRLALR